MTIDPDADMDNTEHGVLYAAAIPRCDIHGNELMRHNFELSRYECHGWDGEGCDRVVTDEQIMRDMRPIGTVAGPIQFKAGQ